MNFNKMVCKHCGARVVDSISNPEEENEFGVLFACGRRVYNNPWSDPWQQIEEKPCGKMVLVDAEARCAATLEKFKGYHRG